MVAAVEQTDNHSLVLQAIRLMCQVSCQQPSLQQAVSKPYLYMVPMATPATNETSA